MGVALEVEAEMAVVLGGVLGLRLGAEDDLRHLLDLAVGAGLVEDAVEIRGTHRIGLRRRQRQ